MSFNVCCQLPLLINIHIPSDLTALLQGPFCKVPFVDPLSQPTEFSPPLPLPSPGQAYFCMASWCLMRKINLRNQPPEPGQAQGGDSQKHAVLMRLVCGCCVWLWAWPAEGGGAHEESIN